MFIQAVRFDIFGKAGAAVADTIFSAIHASNLFEDDVSLRYDNGNIGIASASVVSPEIFDDVVGICVDTLLAKKSSDTIICKYINN